MEEIIDEKTFYTDWNNYWVELIQDDEKPRNQYKLRAYRMVGRWFKKKKYADENDFDMDEMDFVDAAQEFVRAIDRRYRELEKWRRNNGYVPPPAGEEWILKEDEPIRINDSIRKETYEIHPDWREQALHVVDSSDA